MTPLTRHIIVIALVTCTALPAWGQQYLLYSPQPVPSGQRTSSQDGILVQEIDIRKGDTLYGLSRKFSGRGMYFPQILLFNSIKNPNLIYAGSTLRIPLAQNETGDSNRIDTKPTNASPRPKAPAKTPAPSSPVRKSTGSSPVSGTSTEPSLSDLKTVNADKNRTSRSKKKGAVHAKKDLSRQLPAGTSASSQPKDAHIISAEASAGQKLFEAAIKAYRQDDCRTALELLDRFLADHSGSPLAADANLFKAECYLKLSAQ